MPTRRACVAALIPAVVVCGIFWRWLDFPAFIAIGVGGVFGLGGLLVTRSVHDDAIEELEAWRRAAPTSPIWTACPPIRRRPQLTIR